MRRNTYILIALALLLTHCKSAGLRQLEEVGQSIPLIVLLTDNLAPEDIESIKSFEIESMKRISRSQNQWMIKVVGGEDEATRLIEKLNDDKRIIDASLQTKKANSEKIQNTKSGKTKPVKN